MGRSSEGDPQLQYEAQSRQGRGLKTPIATPHLENVFEKIIQHSDKSISDNTLKAIANNLAANEIKK